MAVKIDPARLLLESTVSFILTNIRVPAGTFTILCWAPANVAPMIETQNRSISAVLLDSCCTIIFLSQSLDFLTLTAAATGGNRYGVAGRADVVCKWMMSWN